MILEIFSLLRQKPRPFFRYLLSVDSSLLRLTIETLVIASRVEAGQGYKVAGELAYHPFASLGPDYAV